MWAPFSLFIIAKILLACLADHVRAQRRSITLSYLARQVVVLGSNDVCSGKSQVRRPFLYSLGSNQLPLFEQLDYMSRVQPLPS